MTLVGTVRKSTRFLPRNMQPTKERLVYSTNFAYHRDATVCSNVQKRKKKCSRISVIYAHVERSAETLSAKPEVINYYNKTKGGVDAMDKMLGEYTVKRQTLR